MSPFLPFARLLRLPNVFTALADICMAALAAGALPGRWLPFLCLLLASGCFYCSGMIWNDYFDLEEDRRERSFRPLPSGQIALSTASRLGTALMLGGLALCVLADLGPDGFRFHSTLIGLFLVVAILLYDGFVKDSWLGPVVMGGCRFLNVLLGLSIMGATPFLWGWMLAFVVGLYIAGVTCLARGEANVSNPALLVFGSIVMLLSLTHALMLPPLVQEVDPGHEPPLVFTYLLVGFAFYLALAIVPAIQRPTPRLVQAAVKRSILGLILLDAILASAIAGYAGFAILVLYVPAHFLGRWVYST